MSLTWKGGTRTLMLSLAACWLVSAHAEDTATKIFQDVIDVRVVELEVVVTDKDGHRVTGLGVGDFQITAGGQSYPAEYFAEIRDGEPSRQHRTGSRQAPRSAGTSLLVFLDEVFPIGRDRDMTLDQLIGNVSVLGPNEQVAVVAFDGKRLEMLADWTRSTEVLRGVFEEAKERMAQGLVGRARDKALSKMSTHLYRSEMPARSVLMEQRRRIERVTMAATATMRSFANAPGRKAMLVLSGGWPLGYVNEFAVSPTLKSLPDTLGYRDLYRPVADTANLLGYTLYTVDMKIFHGPGPSAEFRTAGEARANRDQAFALDDAEDATLLSLARETGGMAFLNRKNRQALSATVEDVRNYYSLGFTPDWRGEDRRRSIRVSVRRPGLKVRTRRSFADLSRQTEVTMMVESALLFDKAPAAGTLDVSLAEAAGAGFRKALLPLEIKIPLDGLTFLPLEGAWKTQVELRVAAEDAQGNRNEISVVPVVLSFPSRPPPGRHAVYEFALKMRKKKHNLVVSLYDPISGQLFWNRLAMKP